MNSLRAAKAWKIVIPGFSLLLLLMLVLYRDTALFLARIWSAWEDGGYSHGYLVLLLSGYMIYKKRHVLSRMETCPCISALSLVALSVLVWSLAGLANIQLVQAMVLLPLVLSIILVLVGWQVTRKLLLPVLFIGLAIPVWSPFMPLLQVITAEGAFTLTRIAGIPAFMQGFTIHLPSGRLSVEEACSGLHYLLAGVTLGVFYGWLNYRTFRQRLLVIVLVTVAAIMANILRVFIITWLAHRTEMQHPYVEDHLTLGWYLFAALVVSLLAVDLLIGGHVADSDAGPPATESAQCKYTDNWRYASIFLVIVLLAAGPLASRWIADKVEYRNLQSLALPAGKNGWKGPALAGDDWQPQYKGAVSQTAAYYRAGESVLLYAGYYSRQQQGAELVNVINRIARSDRWRTVKTTSTEIAQDGPAVIEVELESRYAERRLVWYRYRVAGRYTTSGIMAKVFEVAGMLAQRSGASIIAVATEIDDDAEAARERLADFMHSMDEPIVQIADGINVTGGD